jgi:hypothetical protein
LLNFLWQTSYSKSPNHQLCFSQNDKCNVGHFDLLFFKELLFQIELEIDEVFRKLEIDESIFIHKLSWNQMNDPLHKRIHEKEIPRFQVCTLISLIYELANKFEIRTTEKMVIQKSIH